MAELYEDWLVSKMTRAEVKELSPDEKKHRRSLQRKNDYQRNRKELIEYQTKYYLEHREERIEYFQTAAGKKANRISNWVNKMGLQESTEDLDRIYELRETQELCNACDCVLTRNGDRSDTDATMDHDHDTNRFRHIICRNCNIQDRWKQYFC